MLSRAARGTGYRGRGVAVARRAVAGMIESLESRRLMSVTNAIEGVGVIEAGNRVPADPHGAAGPAHVVNVVNSHIQWFTKSGVLQGSQALGTFFTPLGTNSASHVFDPKVVYDQYNDRFVVVALWVEQIADGDLVNDAHALLAVSDDADPNGTWYFQDVDTKVNINGADTWLDYPGLAVSQDAVYLTGNMFTFDFFTQVPTEEPSFGVSGTRLFIIPKGPLYGGAQSFVHPGGYDPVKELGLTAGDFIPDVPLLLTLQPAHMYGATPTGLGTFLTLDAGEDTVTGLDQLYVIRVDNPLGVPVFSSTKLDLGDINTRRYPGVPQPFSNVVPPLFGGLAPRLDGGDPRILSAVWRDGMLYATQVVVPPSGVDQGQVTAHWYQVSTGSTTVVGTPTLFDQGNVGGEDIGVGTHTFYPAVSVNPRGDMAIGFSASGPLSIDNGQGTTPTSDPVYPGAYVTVQLASDRALGRRGFTRPAQVVALGEGIYLDGFGLSGIQMRWGDYSGIAVDIDSGGNETNDFWVYNKYAGAPTSNYFGLFDYTDQWSTRWGKLTPELVDLPAVGNFVWDDKNGNGVQDAGEPGLAGVVFRLVDGAGNVLQQTTSDANGFWYLQGPPTGGAVPGGTYRVVADITAVSSTGVSLFDGYTYSPTGQGNALTDSNFVRSATNPFQAQTALMLFAPLMLDETIDLGLFKPFAKLTTNTPTIQEGGPGSVRQASYTVTLYTGVLNDGVQHTLESLDLESPWTTRIYYSTIGTTTVDPQFVPAGPVLQVVPLPAVSATGGQDYFEKSAELLTIPALVGSVTADLVPVLGDATPEGDESFALILLQPSDLFEYINQNLPPGVPVSDLPLRDTVQFMTPADRIVSVKILDDDLAVLSVDAGPTVVEPAVGKVAYALFTIRLSVPNPLSTPVAVRYRLIDGTARGGTADGGADYSNVGGVVDFAPGQLTKTVRVPVYGDSRGKERNETFTLEVEAVNSGQLTNDVLAKRRATATIVNAGSKTLKFGGGKSLTFRDIAGNQVTVTLTGPGTGTVVTTSTGEGRGLELNGTTEKSVLTIRTNRGQASFSGITVNGGLARLDAPTTNISGSLTSTEAIRDLTLNFVTGGEIILGPSADPDVLISIDVRRIANSSLTSDTSIRELLVGSWIDTGPEDFLVAPVVRTIRATGDFGASVQPWFGDIQTVTVGGTLKNAELVVTRPAGGGVRGVIGSVTVGRIQGSLIEAGTRINSVTVRRLFSNSTIKAPQIGTLELGTVKNTTGSQLIAAQADRIQSVRWTFNGTTTRITNVDNPGPRGLDRDVDEDPQIILDIT